MAGSDPAAVVAHGPTAVGDPVAARSRATDARGRPDAARTSTTYRAALLVCLVAALCLVEAALRLGAQSPDTRFTLPAYGLGYFWDTPLGWTGVMDGTPVNRDSSQFESLAAFLRGQPDLFIPLDANVYTRFSGYALLGGILAPFLGRYLGFVACNVALWVAGALATYALAVRRTRSTWVATLAAVLVATAPAFSALVGQALPYVASYGLFAAGLWFCERVGLFERGVRPATAALAGLAVGAALLVYDLYMLPLFVLLYGFRRIPLLGLGAFLATALIPKLTWAVYWSVAQLPRYTQNDSHPLESLQAWLAIAQRGFGWHQLIALGALAAHVGFNILAAFLFVPALLAVWPLARWRQLPDVRWYLAVLIAGFAPAAFMVSTWPHIPRWYAYGFPAIYILAATAAVQLSQTLTRAQRGAWARRAIGVAVLLPNVVLANLDVVGFTRPMELFLFQPQHWSYLWQR